MSSGPRLRILLFASSVRAGFPSATENYVERVCDLNISNAQATYFVRVTGDFMTGDRIGEGDVLIVDCSREATDV